MADVNENTINEDKISRSSLTIRLNEQCKRRFDKERNRSGLATDLIENYYEEKLVKLNIANDTLAKYREDVNKPFIVDLLLTSYYNGNIDCKGLSILSNNSTECGVLDNGAIIQNENTISASTETLLTEQIENSVDIGPDMLKGNVNDEIATDEYVSGTENIDSSLSVDNNTIEKETKIIDAEKAIIKEANEQGKGRTLNIGNSVKTKVSLVGKNLDKVPRT